MMLRLYMRPHISPTLAGAAVWHGVLPELRQAAFAKDLLAMREFLRTSDEARWEPPVRRAPAKEASLFATVGYSLDDLDV